MPLRSRVALVLLALTVVIVAAAPLLPIADPYAAELVDRLLPIGSDGHPLGTDAQGRDMLSRLIYGTQLSLIAGVVPAVVATVLGTAIGVAAALANRWGNAFAMRAIDIVFAFPNTLFALLLSIALGTGLETMLIALTIVGLAPVAKVAETEAARVKDLDYLVVARTSGASPRRVVVTQMIPVISPGIIAYATGMVGANIAIAGGLGFIGLGVQPPTPELGGILNDMQIAIFVQPTLALLPALVIILLAVLFPLVGDGLRIALGGRKEES